MSTETLDVSQLGPERFMHITTAKPMTRRRRLSAAVRCMRLMALPSIRAATT